MSARLIILLLSSLAIAAAAQDVEPPLEFTITVDGKPSAIALDQPVQVDVAGHATTVKLSVLPTRQFALGGLRFRYPRGFVFAAEAGDDLTSWTLTGNDVVVTVNSYPAAFALENLEQGMVDQFAKMHAGIIARGPAPDLVIGDHAADGRLLRVQIGTTMFQYEIYQVAVGARGASLSLQDTLGEDGAHSQEYQELLRTLHASLGIAEAASP